MFLKFLKGLYAQFHGTVLDISQRFKGYADFVTLGCSAFKERSLKITCTVPFNCFYSYSWFALLGRVLNLLGGD